MIVITWTCWGWLYNWLPEAKLEAIRSPPALTRNRPGRLTRVWTGTPQPPFSGLGMERTDKRQNANKYTSNPYPPPGK